MDRFLIPAKDKSSRKTEGSAFPFWETAMQRIGVTFPPVVVVDTVKEAYALLASIISRCGAGLILDFMDYSSADHFDGVECDDETLRLIWYSVDKTAQGESSDPKAGRGGKIRIVEQVFGKNLESQFGMRFERMVVTPSYLLLYAKEQALPTPCDAEEERIVLDTDGGNNIYVHQWGSFKTEPILQYQCRYYCAPGLTCIVTPLGHRNAFDPRLLFEVNPV